MSSLVLLKILIVLSGCGLFLRIVGKEKHRRESHLKARYEAKLSKIKKLQVIQRLAEEADARRRARQMLGTNDDVADVAEAA